MSIARDTLEKARYFVDRAVDAEADPSSKRIGFVADLQAAIVFGDAVWDHLRAEFKHKPGFSSWESGRSAYLQSQPIYLFISQPGSRNRPGDQLGMRHFILHRGGEPINLTVAVGLLIKITSKMTVDAQVIRAKPWYRRSPRIIIHDLTYPARVRWRKFRDELAALRQQQASQPAGRATLEQTYYFDDANWRTEPAQQIVRKYLDMMKSEIDDAERLFS